MCNRYRMHADMQILVILAAATHTMVLLLLLLLLHLVCTTMMCCVHPAVCPPGTFGSTCADCPVGNFCPGGSSSSRDSSEAPMFACPVHMTSPAESISIADCQCVAGYGGFTCEICKSGSFSVGGSRAECELCDAGQISIEGAPSQDYCSCPPGQGGNCTDCPRGTWGANGVCTSCPSGTTSAVGATGPDQCFCPPGTYGADCAECLAGSYCVGGKDAPIQACEANRYSNSGAKAVGECFCVAGGWMSYVLRSADRALLPCVAHRQGNLLVLHLHRNSQLQSSHAVPCVHLGAVTKPFALAAPASCSSGLRTGPDPACTETRRDKLKTSFICILA